MSVRAAEPADLDAVYALLERWAASLGEDILSRSFLESQWSRTDVVRLVAERDGAIVGHGVVGDGGDLSVCGEADGLVEALLERSRERGDDRLEAVIPTRDVAVAAALEAAGFEHERDVWRMRLDLRGEQPPPQLPDGVAVRAYRDADARPLHALIELAFAENNERILPFDEWLRFMTAHDDFDPAFFHLAEADDGLVACALTWKPFEGKGWLKDLAVHPAHRRRGLGEAMNAVAAAAYRAAGVEWMGLKVDVDNPTGALRLYARLGYERVRDYAVYARLLA